MKNNVIILEMVEKKQINIIYTENMKGLIEKEDIDKGINELCVGGIERVND